MALTGPGTVVLAVVLFVSATAAAMLLWNRGGPGSGRLARVGRPLARVTLMLAAQTSAVVLVAVLLNDTGNFYTSWRELAGERHTISHAVQGVGNQDQTLHDALARAAAQRRGLIVKLPIPGPSSGIATSTARVYLPAQYSEPDYANRAFPVIELIAGSPGTPETWTDSLNVAHILDQEISAGRTLPLIAVMPSQDVAGGRDTQCVNIPRGPQVETYLTLDVRAAVTHAFRASTHASGWAVMGYSSGGFCATNLAMRHPELFATAISIAGYARPAHDRQTGDLFGRNTALQEQNTPLWRAAHLPSPNIALLLISSAADPSTATDAAALATALRTPATVARLALHHGGHNFQVWQAEEPIAFAWISTHLTAPLAPPPIVDHTAPTPTSN